MDDSTRTFARNIAGRRQFYRPTAVTAALRKGFPGSLNRFASKILKKYRFGVAPSCWSLDYLRSPRGKTGPVFSLHQTYQLLFAISKRVSRVFKERAKSPVYNKVSLSLQRRPPAGLESRPGGNSKSINWDGEGKGDIVYLRKDRVIKQSMGSGVSPATRGLGVTGFSPQLLFRSCKGFRSSHIPGTMHGKVRKSHGPSSVFTLPSRLSGEYANVSIDPPHEKGMTLGAGIRKILRASAQTKQGSNMSRVSPALQRRSVPNITDPVLPEGVEITGPLLRMKSRIGQRVGHGVTVLSDRSLPSWRPRLLSKAPSAHALVGTRSGSEDESWGESTDKRHIHTASSVGQARGTHRAPAKEFPNVNFLRTAPARAFPEIPAWKNLRTGPRNLPPGYMGLSSCEDIKPAGLRYRDRKFPPGRSTEQRPAISPYGFGKKNAPILVTHKQKREFSPFHPVGTSKRPDDSPHLTYARVAHPPESLYPGTTPAGEVKEAIQIGAPVHGSTRPGAPVGEKTLARSATDVKAMADRVYGLIVDRVRRERQIFGR